MTAVSLTLRTYRDDGLAARALGGVLGRIAAVPASALVAVAALPLLVLAVLEGDGGSDAEVGLALAWAIVFGGISQGRPQQRHLAWAIAPLLRALEYGAIIWIAAISGEDVLPAAFALVAAVAFRHNDDVYRLRFQGVPAPSWVTLVGGGWDGRLVMAYVLLVTDALPAGFYILAAVLAILFVGESISAWVRFNASTRPVLHDEEGDDEA